MATVSNAMYFFPKYSVLIGSLPKQAQKSFSDQNLSIADYRVAAGTPFYSE